MRSVIKEANMKGIKDIVDQQFSLAKQIAAKGLIPIIEPEVDIFSKDKEASEILLKKEILAHLAALPDETKIMCKLSIPTIDGFYSDLMKDPHVVRVVALSGGYSQVEANQRLTKNPGLIASFSRALAQGLSAQQSKQAFDDMLQASILAIFKASIT